MSSRSVRTTLAKGRTRLRRSLPLVRAIAATAAYLVWTLAPFALRSPSLTGLWRVALDDLAGNVLSTVALGWLWAEVVGIRRAVLLGVALACGVETAQVFIATRAPALSDIVANVVGVSVGAVWWSRREVRAPRVATGILVIVLFWAIASRYGAPGRPVGTVALFAALAAARLRRVLPRSGADVAAFALVGTAGFAGLAPAPLTIAALGGTLAGVLAARPLDRWRRSLAAAVPLVLLVETWPPFRLAARPGDGALMVSELGMVALTALLFVIEPE